MGNASVKDGFAVADHGLSEHRAPQQAFPGPPSSSDTRYQQQHQISSALSLDGSAMALNPPPHLVSQYQMDELGWPHSTLYTQPEHKIATLIEWHHGGTEVFVEGSWDNWSTRIPLHRAGKDFTLVKFLPEGVYHYRFLVNGEWRHSPDFPYLHDEMGNPINVLDVQDLVAENLDGVQDLEAPGSPDVSYDSPFFGPEEYSKDPPLLPSQLHLNNQLECCYPLQQLGASAIRPQHVILNHLFVESRKAAAASSSSSSLPSSCPVLAIGFTHRFRTKYVTVILHKPFSKR